MPNTEQPKPTPTHVVTTPNTRPPTAIEVLRSNVTNPEGAFLKSVVTLYGGNKEEAVRFSTAAVEYVRRVPKLLECDAVSLMAAFVQSAQFRFLPSGVSGEAYIIPYGKEAKFQIGYRGIVTLLSRTNKVKSIKAIVVYENERFEYEEGMETRLVHIPTKFGEQRGEAIGVYAVAETVNGGRQFMVMSKDQVMAIKAMSKAKDKADSPWNSKDPEKWMWKKTCLIQLSKLLPQSPDLQMAIEKDYEGEGIDDSGRPDPMGIAAAPALHEPPAAPQIETPEQPVDGEPTPTNDEVQS